MSTSSRRPKHRKAEQRYRKGINYLLDELSAKLDEIRDDDPAFELHPKFNSTKVNILAAAADMLSRLHTAIDAANERHSGLCIELEKVGEQVRCDLCPVVDRIRQQHPDAAIPDLFQAEGVETMRIQKRTCPTCQHELGTLVRHE